VALTTKASVTQDCGEHRSVNRLTQHNPMSIDAPHNDRWVFLEFSIVTSKDFCTATPALSQACSANEAKFY